MIAFLKRLFCMSTTITGDPRFGFTVEIDGDDLVAKSVSATWFGGSNDPEDNGETASGISTAKNPLLMGCSLPMDFGPCKGSPIPRLPWKTIVEVTHEGQTIQLPVIDLGPSRGTGNAIDLTQAAFRRFHPLSVGKIKVDFRIIGGAKHLKT